VLTVSSVTGTEERAALLAARWPALAEAMEGHAVATAAAVHGVPVAELRAVSNVIGRRDRDGWDLPRAFAALAAAGPALTSLALDTADSVATVPAPSEPAPSEPAPSEPAPSEPAPAEPEKQPWP
jgi:futalosine hydrolase